VSCFNLPSHRALAVVTLVFSLTYSHVASADQPNTSDLWGSFVAQVKSYTDSVLRHFDRSEDANSSRVLALQDGPFLEQPQTKESFGVSYEFEDPLSINLDRYMKRSDAFKLTLDAKGVDLSTPTGYGNITLSYERSMKHYSPMIGGDGVMLSFSQAW